jgi:uncharacterized protein (DUF2141 family)
MKKLILFFFAFIGIMHFVYSDVHTNINVQNVTINGGKIYIGIYFTEKVYRDKKPNIVLEAEPASTTINVETTLPEGEYVINAYQDVNNNGKVDIGLFFIPKEPVGITNFTGGIPGNFNRLKVLINREQNMVIINLINL